VVNNLEVTNNIDLPRPVRTRVLTAPLETFRVGNTSSSAGIDRRASRRGSRGCALARTRAHRAWPQLAASMPSMIACLLRRFHLQQPGFKHIPKKKPPPTKSDRMLNNSLTAKPITSAVLQSLQAALLSNALLTTPGQSAGETEPSAVCPLWQKGPALDNNKSIGCGSALGGASKSIPGRQGRM